MQGEMIELTIDDQKISVPKGTTVYEASRKLGIELPIFCYQDRMPPFGACRVCLVEVEKMGKLQASCTLQATEGMIVHTESDRAVKGREGILELLLINHPLDCPICDRGGECALQEFALEHGPGESRFYEEKRHFTKGIPLGPVLTLDRERCIVCARCTRFGETVAGDSALTFIDRGFKTEVGTPDGEPAKSKFIGNTIMICPVGALTSQVYRFRARPWDNRSNETSCTLCPVGCSMILDERDGEIQRTRSLTDKEVNDIWLCDKGWFGYEFADSKERLKHPLIRRNGELQKASWDEALSVAAEKIRDALPDMKIAALGGNPLTTEENYLFQKLFRSGLGVPHIDHRVGMPLFSLEDEGTLDGMQISPEECESLSYFYLIGCDITEEFPLLWLRLKQAMNHGAKGIFIGHYAPEVSSLLTETILISPGERVADHIQTLEGKGALFIGRQYLASHERRSVLDACKQLTGLSVNLLEGRGNSRGAAWAGMRPDLKPAGEKINEPGLDVLSVLESAAQSGWGVIYCAGANLARKYPAALFNQARSKTRCLIVQDLFMTETAEQADIVLPTLSFLEKRGSMINIEGRVRGIGRGKLIPEGLLSDQEIFKLLARKLNVAVDMDEAFLQTLQVGKVHFPERPRKSKSQASPSNGLKAYFEHVLFDHGERMLRNTHLVQLAKDPKIRMHPQQAETAGIREGSRIEVSSKEGKVEGIATLDSGVSNQIVLIPLGFKTLQAHELGRELWNGMAVTLRKIS
jgi:NADH-quinone oxidoreductase subunit G